jgi:hypothetical protein
MSLAEFVISVVWAVSSTAFGWALSASCSQPQGAKFLYLVACVTFAASGPVWVAAHRGSHRMGTQITVGIGTAAIAAAAWFFTASTFDACAQAEKPPVNCSNSVGGSNLGSLSNNCGNVYNVAPQRFKFSPQIADELISKYLREKKHVRLVGIGVDAEYKRIVDQYADYLKANGYEDIERVQVDAVIPAETHNITVFDLKEKGYSVAIDPSPK